MLLYGGSYPGAYLLKRGLFMPWELDLALDRETLTEGLRRLTPLAQQVLAVAAVLAPHLRVEMLVETSGRSELETVDSLDELLAQCDASAEINAEDRTWLDSKPVGSELL